MKCSTPNVLAFNRSLACSSVSPTRLAGCTSQSINSLEMAAVNSTWLKRLPGQARGPDDHPANSTLSGIAKVSFPAAPGSLIQRLGLNSFTSEPQVAGSKCKPFRLTETQVLGGIIVEVPLIINGCDLSAVYFGSRGMAEKKRWVSY